MDHAENERLLIALEVGLLDPTVRGSAAQLADIFAADFVEFGSSGRAYGKEDIIAYLLAESDAQRDVHRVADNFKVRWLADDAAFTTYELSRTENGNTAKSLRTSIWKFYNERWQMIFHQGTIMSW